MLTILSLSGIKQENPNPSEYLGSCLPVYLLWGPTMQSNYAVSCMFILFPVIFFFFENMESWNMGGAKTRVRANRRYDYPARKKQSGYKVMPHTYLSWSTSTEIIGLIDGHICIYI